MPNRIRFHLDENVSGAIAAGLRRQGIDVTTTPESGLLGADDPEQVQFAKMENRVIFTQDQDFLRLHHVGVSHAGIAYCTKEERTIGEIIRGLVLIWEALDPEDMENQVEFI